MNYAGASHKAIMSDTRDQYRLFNMLEHFLQSPPMLEKQMLLQIAPDIQQLLIEKWVLTFNPVNSKFVKFWSFVMYTVSL